MHRPLLRSLSLSVMLLSACAVGPTYQAPKIALTPSFHGGSEIADAAGSDRAWWQEFHDPGLSAVIAKTLDQNLDLQAAGARIEQARARAQFAGAALLPHAEAVADVSRHSESFNTPTGEVLRLLPGATRGYELYSVGTQASWEIDLFGGLRRGREAAVAAAQSTEATAAAVRTATAAEAGDAYLSLRGLQARLQVAQAQEQNEVHLTDLIRQQVAQGVAADRDLRRALGDLEGVRATMPPLQAAIDAQINRLDVLMGLQAGTDPQQLALVASLPEAPAPRGSREVSDLLRRRPDIVAAERHLQQTNALIGAAIAEYYPKVSLDGLFGVASLTTGGLMTANAVDGEAGAGLRWRLFDFGRVDAEVAKARGDDAEALAQYRATVLRATEDVETAASRLAQDRAQVTILERQIADLATARDQAQSAYENGVLSLIDVLDVNRTLLAASDQLAAARADRGRASVAAYRALGGGWSG